MARGYIRNSTCLYTTPRHSVPRVVSDCRKFDRVAECSAGKWNSSVCQIFCRVQTCRTWHNMAGSVWGTIAGFAGFNVAGTGIVASGNRVSATRAISSHVIIRWYLLLLPCRFVSQWCIATMFVSKSVIHWQVSSIEFLSRLSCNFT